MSSSVPVNKQFLAQLQPSRAMLAGPTTAGGAQAARSACRFVVTFFLDGAVMRWVQKHWNPDQYLHPIFRRRRR